MIDDLPLYVPVVFIITTLLTAALFLYAAGGSTATFVVFITWLGLQAVLAWQDFYKITGTIPPRFVLAIVPAALLIVFLFATRRGGRFIDRLNTRQLTYLHTVRIPVEIVLFWLCANKVIPEVMTFEGRNFDIFSGITAPLAAYFGYTRNKLGKPLLLLWNFICLGLVLNVVIHGVLAVPSVFQQIAFDQPNTAVLYFPFIWLPCFVVPVVIFSHLVCIRQLLKK